MLDLRLQEMTNQKLTLHYNQKFVFRHNEIIQEFSLKYKINLFTFNLLHQ